MSVISKIMKALRGRAQVGRAQVGYVSSESLPSVMGSPISEAPTNSASKIPERYTMESRKYMAEMPLVIQLENHGIYIDQISIEVLGLGTRAFNALKHANIHTIGQIVNCTERDLLGIDGLGVVSLEEIQNKVNSLLSTLSGGRSQELETAGLNTEVIDVSLLQSIQNKRIPLYKTSVQVLGLTELESNELAMFKINTIQELINCAKNGFLSVQDLEITTVEEIKKKLNSYLVNLSSGGDWSLDTTEISKNIAQLSFHPVDLSAGLRTKIIEHHSEIADPLLLIQLEEQGIDLKATSVEWLDLGVRASKRLKTANIVNLRQLIDCTQRDLLSIDGLGITTIKEIEEKLDACLCKMLEGTSLREQARAQAIQISKQLWELASRLCRTFEDYVPLDEIRLPYFAQQSLHKAIGESPKTLADLRQLTKSHNSQINAPEQKGQTYYQIHALKQAVDCLYWVLNYRNIDCEVNELIRLLDDREYFILTNRFGIRKNLTLEMIGGQFDFTRERARQIEYKMRGKLIRMVARAELMYSVTGIALIECLGENATVDSWIQQLINIGFLKEETSADLLVAISRVTNTSPLVLPKEFDSMLEPRISPHILWAKKPVLSKARRNCRNSGAVRAVSLTSERVSEADVKQILTLDGFTEVYPGWWMKKGNKSVAEGIATKVITYCGAVSPSNLRQAFIRHLSRRQFSAPPSEVLVKVLEHTGNFALADGFVKLIRSPTRKPGLTGPESIFLKTVHSEGPVVSFELLHTKIVEEGFSTPSVTSLLHYSPIVERIAFGLYALIGTPYDVEDIERTKSQLTRVSADTRMKPRPDGVIEFETNIGTWMIYGGVLSSGPAASLEGNWTLVVDDTNETELVVGGGFIRGLSDAVVSLDLMPMDRIKIEFNTWTREARITKVVNNE